MSLFQKILIGLLSVCLLCIGYYFVFALPAHNTKILELQAKEVQLKQDQQVQQLIEADKTRSENNEKEEKQQNEIFRKECGDSYNFNAQKYADFLNICQEKHTLSFCENSEGANYYKELLSPTTTLKCIDGKKRNYNKLQ